EHWERELGRDLPSGYFGENLTTVGLDVTGAVIGERWRLGEDDDSVVLEVRMPRTPCQTFARRMGEERWVRRFSDHGAVGAYCSVVQPGRVVAGARIDVIERPTHGVTVGEVFHARRTDPLRLQAMVEQLGDAMAVDLRRPIALALGHARKAGLLPA
ncbi:MAG: MOSC domain-containing protein, partial [Actinomycetales bacterium]